MSDSVDVSTPYFIRRLTPELAADLVADAPVTARDARSAGEPESGWDRFIAGAKQMGVAIKEVIGSALFETKPRVARKYRPGTGSTVTRNLYGHFLLVEKADGTLDICREPDTYTFPKGCTVYIVADLVGMPIARLTGEVSTTSMSLGSGPGLKSDGEYLIDLWLDPGDGRGHELSDDAKQRLGRFLANVLGGRDSLTVDELVQATRGRLAPFLNGMLDVPSPGKSWVMGQPLPDQAAMLAQAIEEFQRKASEFLGLTLSVRFRPGVQYFRHRVILNEQTREAAQRYAISNWELIQEDGQWTCASADCGATNARAAKFCADCGGPSPSATAEVRDANQWKLVTRDAQDLDLEIAFISFGQEAVDSDGITAGCIDALRNECRRIVADDLNDPAVIARFNQALNNQMATGRYGMIGEFQVVYFSTAEEEWKRQVAVQLRQDLRDIEASTQRLAITDEALSLRELQLLRDRRDTDIWRQELSAGLDRARIEASNQLAHEDIDVATDLARDKRTVQTNLEKQRIATEAVGEEMRFTRDVEQQAKTYARQDQVQEATERRLDEMAELDHDLLKDDKVDAARRKAEQDAADLQARIDRLKSSVKIDEKRQEQDLDLDRKRSEQDLDLSAASVKSKLEIEKLRAMAEMEALQREQQSKMSAAQLMALQASSLAEKGATDALTQLASHDGKTAEATAEAKVAKMQADMLERMMAMQAQSQAQQTDASKDAMAQQMQLMMMAMQQQQSTSTAAMLANQEAIKAAMLGQQATNSRLQEAQQQTADAAVAWNTRSIDAMSQVASTKAGNPGSPVPPAAPTAAAGPPATGTAPKFCPSCGAAVTGAGKFCMECGQKLVA